ncbi:hypothetical protein Tco_0798561 [Tanacetum coccineum]
MRTRNSYFPNNSPVTIPRRRNRRRAPNVVEPELRTIVEVAPMADNRTMEELLQAPTEGYGEVIVIPEINAGHFEIKTNLLQLVQASPFLGFERDNPHTHINNFKRITSTLKLGVLNDVIKLMMFPYSLEGAARIWTNEFPHCPCSTCARCGSNLVNGDCFNCSTYSSANNYSPNLYTTPPHFSDYSCHYSLRIMWKDDAHYGYPCPSFVPDPCYNRNFDCFPHDSQTLPQQYQTPPVVSMEMLHAQTDHNKKLCKTLEEIKQVVEEEQTQPEYLQDLLQSLFKDLQILNEIQPLKQETLNQILKDQEEKSIAELLAEERLQKANQAINKSQSPQEMRIQDLEIQKQQVLEEMKEWMNDLGIREIRKEEIDIDYRRKCEDKIYELKDKFNGLSIEIRKIIQEAEELRESEARARSQKIIIDDDDDDLGFYAVHPNTIHTPVSTKLIVQRFHS